MEWEGRLAFAELERADALDFLLGEGKWETKRQTEHLFRKMFHEIEVYQKEAQSRPMGQRIAELDKRLIAKAEKIKKEKDKEPFPDLKQILEQLRIDTYGRRGALTALRFLSETKFGFWNEMIWRDLPSRKVVARQMELDTRLQVELAKVLVFYLREKTISLRRTIARLILLAYWAGDLSGLTEIPVKVSQQKRKKKGRRRRQVVTPTGTSAGTTSATMAASKAIYTGRPLRLKNIYDNLREARLHKSAAFQLESADRLFMDELKKARKILGPAGSGLPVLPQLYLRKFIKARGLTQQHQITRLIAMLRNPQEYTQTPKRTRD
jgi:hypothetical protein